MLIKNLIILKFDYEMRAQKWLATLIETKKPSIYHQPWFPEINKCWESSPTQFCKPAHSRQNTTMHLLSSLVKETVPNYLSGLPIPDTIGGWFKLGSKTLHNIQLRLFISAGVFS